MSFTGSLDEQRLARLIDVGRSLLSELDIDVVLDRLLETAAELTGARYAAIGILDDSRRELGRFITRGIDEETHRALVRLPAGASADADVPRRADRHPRRGVGATST